MMLRHGSSVDRASNFRFFFKLQDKIKFGSVLEGVDTELQIYAVTLFHVSHSICRTINKKNLNFQH